MKASNEWYTPFLFSINKMKKIIYAINLVLLITLSACNKDAETNSPLVGTWDRSNGKEYYTFYSDGTGQHDYMAIVDVKPGGSSTSRWLYSRFSWEANGTHLFLNINYDSYDGNINQTRTYYYTLSGKNLALYYTDGEYNGTWVKR